MAHGISVGVPAEVQSDGRWEATQSQALHMSIKATRCLEVREGLVI